ncbi:MAG TPA: SPFH domain-containing protein [Haliangiales bacterium]|nr:SPFH domain-containing protein [Haliangiales bacterium]
MSDIKPRQPLSPSSLLAGLLRLIWRILRIKVVWITLVVLLALYFGAGACTTYVPPNAIGIKQVYYGSSAGIRKDLYGPGLHFLAAGVERLHLFPRDLQIVNFSSSASELSQRARNAPAINVQTSDGYKVTLDVSVLYRITDPYTLFKEAGSGRAFEDKLIIPRADQILRRTLGELNSEEFYQGPKRIEKARHAKEQLAAQLTPFGVEIDEVLVRQYVYDERYQEIIEGRKLKDQTVFLREAEAKAAMEQANVDKIVATGKANVEVELARGDAEVKKIDAEADLYRRQKAAQGQLLVELAEAQGTKLENDALQGAGSEYMVGLKMAEVFGGVKVLVVSSDKDGINPLDVSSLLKKFEVP